MPNGFNIKEGFLKLLKELVHDDRFISLVIDLLLGRKSAPEGLKSLFMNASYDQSLNEVVVAHRMFRTALNEEFEPFNGKDKNLLRAIAKLQKKSFRFQRQVIIKAMRKSGVPAALYKLIKTRGTDPKAWVVVAQAVVDALYEISQEEDGKEIKAMLAENVEDSYGGRIPVNVYVGRFQPFHLGHLSCVHEAAKYGLRTVICPVMKGKSASAGEHPFDDEIEMEMFGRLKDSYEDIADIIPVKNSFIEFWVYPLREHGFEPITWTTGKDRVPSYQAMVDKYREKYELAPNFKILPLDKNVDAEGGSASNTSDISGTRVRECLMNDDREGFMRQMPECLHDMYDEMRRALVGEPEPAVSLAENNEYEEYRKRIDEAITKLVKGNK